MKIECPSHPSKDDSNYYYYVPGRTHIPINVHIVCGWKGSQITCCSIIATPLLHFPFRQSRQLSPNRTTVHHPPPSRHPHCRPCPTYAPSGHQTTTDDFHFFYFHASSRRRRGRFLYSQFRRRFSNVRRSSRPSYVLNIYVSASLILLISLGTSSTAAYIHRYGRVHSPGWWWFSFQFQFYCYAPAFVLAVRCHTTHKLMWST